MTPPDPLAAGRRAFARALPDRLALLEALMPRAETGPDRAAALRDIAQIAHRIAGTAETLGHAEIGALARRIDRALTDTDDRSAARRSVATAADRAALIGALRAVCDGVPENWRARLNSAKCADG